MQTYPQHIAKVLFKLLGVVFNDELRPPRIR